MAVILRRKERPKPQGQGQGQDIDKFLIDMWRYENEVRKSEGLPPIPWEVWLSWYKWHNRQAQQEGGRP
jgi:hypothetical protein